MKNLLFFLFIALSVESFSQGTMYTDTLGTVTRNGKKLYPVKNIYPPNWSEEDYFIFLVNLAREEACLPPVKRMVLLDSASAIHNSWIIKNDSLSHFEDAALFTAQCRMKAVDSTVFKRLDRVWVRENVQYSRRTNDFSDDPYRYLDNIYDSKWCTTTSFEVWMNSPGHRAAILDPNIQYLGFNQKKGFSTRTGNYVFAATMVAACNRR